MFGLSREAGIGGELMTPKEKQKLLSQLEHWLSVVQIRLKVLPLVGDTTAYHIDLLRAFEMVIRFLREEE